MALGRHKRRPVQGCPVSRGENETRNEAEGRHLNQPRSPGGLPGGNTTWWPLFSHSVMSDSLRLNNRQSGYPLMSTGKKVCFQQRELHNRRSSGGSPQNLQLPSVPFVMEPAGRPPDTGPATLGKRSTEGLERISRFLAQGDFRKPERTPLNP